MPFEEFAPARPPAKAVVGRDEVVMSVRPHLRSTKDARFADKRMVEVTIGAGVALRLGWTVSAMPADADPALPNVRVLFGSGPDRGKMQLMRGSTVSYKPRSLKGGAVKLTITAMPDGAPAEDFRGKAVTSEVLRPAPGGEAYLLVTLPQGFLPSSVDRRKAV